jgi:hypothetical protein
MTRHAAAAVLAEVAGAGHCVHPVVLSGETVDTVTGEILPSTLRIACKDRRSTICPSCSYLYKTDAWILISAGLVGGKGLPEDVADHPRIFVTLTAPSFGRVHRQTKSGECHEHAKSRSCVHGAPVGCAARHLDDDPDLGAPLCVECFDYEDAVKWNAAASMLWHRTIVRLRQGVAATRGLSEGALLKLARLNYLKVAEFQRRGLVHFHMVLRADGPEAAVTPPPLWLTTELLATELRRLVRTATLRTPSGFCAAWGSQISILDLVSSDEESRKVSSYLAKYATKSTDGSVAFSRCFHRRSQIERARVAPHARRMALTAWDLGDGADLEPLGMRRHAHAFGFTGQLITKSQGFSTTFGSLRAARAAHMAGLGDPTSMGLGTHRYAGRGYSDPRGEAVAQLLHEATVELHQGARERRLSERRESRDDCRDGSRSHSQGFRNRSRDVSALDTDPQ